MAAHSVAPMAAVIAVESRGAMAASLAYSRCDTAGLALCTTGAVRRPPTEAASGETRAFGFRLDVQFVQLQQTYTELPQIVPKRTGRQFSGAAKRGFGLFSHGRFQDW